MFPRMLALTGALVILPTLAAAQPYYRQARGPRYEPPYQELPYASRRSADQCTAWCPQDYNPCDPANFKIADGRCKPAGVQGIDR